MTCVMLRLDKVSVVVELHRRGAMHHHHIISVCKRSQTRCRAGAARSSRQQALSTIWWTEKAVDSRSVEHAHLQQALAVFFGYENK